MKRLTRLLTFVLLLVPALPALAHKLAPSLLELRETAAAEYAVEWKTPRFTSTRVPITPQFPAGCADTGTRTAAYEGTGVRLAWQTRCDAPLAGQALGVTGLAENQSAALIRVVTRDGAVAQALVNGEDPVFRVPERTTRLQVAADYTLLGIQHILGGIDHLLFVLGLLLLVAGFRRLVWTITAFTAGHSVTLALATLGFLSYPVALVEFLIAASIFVVAVELARGRSERHWLRRRPWLAAGLFGLLHGMGFAGALQEVGLPAHEIPLALLTFNVGIELGQLLFVAAALLVARIGSCYAWLQRPLVHAVPVYAIGVLSAYWCLERGAAALPGL